MTIYVLRTFDPAGRLIDRQSFRGSDDRDAAGRMRQPREDHWCELWAGSRLVMILDGAKMAASSARARSDWRARA